MKTIYKTNSYEETQDAAKALARTLVQNDVILLYGDLGAGKTCFTNGILYGLGFSSGGSSPTFTVVNEYPTAPPVNHFDLYRLKSEEELFDMGFAEYFDRGAVSIIEWPDIAEEFLEKRKTVTVSIKFTKNDDEREIIIERH